MKEVIVTATNNGPYTVGQTIEILATGGEYYSWTGPNNFTSNLASPTIPNILSANAGIYNVTVTQNGCSTTATTNVIVNGIDPCVRLVDYLYVKAGNPYQPLFLLKDGMEISEISGQVSILVNPVCLNTVIKSFEMNIQGPNLNWNIWQNVYFYALFDNVGLNVFGRNFIPGNYTLTTTGYSLENKGGTKTYGPVITRFSVVANPATISQVTTSKNSICAGNNLDVSFTTSGTFDAKNLFKIELSDVNGSFENPLIIGTSSTAEKVSCLIPLSTIASDKYLIRVVSSNQVLAGNPSTNTFTVNPLLINLTSPNNDFSTGDNTKKAVTIMASNKVISLAKVNFQGGKAIVLNAGFEAKNGTVFKAEIGGCEN